MAVLFEKTKLLTDKQFHYCPGCNHGIIHRLVAEVIDEMKLDGKVIGVAPVGCSVFAYDYFNCDMYEAAHGRAPAVATGIKRVRRQGHSGIHLSGRRRPGLHRYRGDRSRRPPRREDHHHLCQQRDLRHDRRSDGPHHPDRPEGNHLPCWPQRGVEWSAYQACARCWPLFPALTTLSAWRSTIPPTSPRPRRPSPRPSVLQMEGKGFTMIEVLSTCPTNWGLSPVEAMNWLEQNMIPYYPLGVYKDKEAK